MIRFFFIFMISFFGINSMNSQIHEIGGFVGGSNYIGDVGPTDFVSPNKFAFGFLYKWNKSPRHAWRFSYMQSEIYASDKQSDIANRVNRNYRFKNSIKEFSAGLEFNFFDFNLHDFKTKITPYIYTGVSGFVYNQLFFVNGQPKKDYQDGGFAIPMIVGVKTNFLRNFILGAEIGARYTLTDNIDGSNPKNPNLNSLRFGNYNSNDWYVFSGFTLTYTFGDKPCYCKD
jgi:Domain of unknown function (DUF6089)